MNGTVLGVPQTLSYFEKMQDRIVRFVCSNSKMSAHRFKQLMLANGQLVNDVGSVIDGETAVREGLIDRLGGLSDVIQCLYDMIENDSEKEVIRSDSLVIDLYDVFRTDIFLREFSKTQTVFQHRSCGLCEPQRLLYMT